MFLNNNWILLEFLKTFIKVYVRQVFVNVWWNFIFSGHHVRQVLKNCLQPCCIKVYQQCARKIKGQFDQFKQSSKYPNGNTIWGRSQSISTILFQESNCWNQEIVKRSNYQKISVEKDKVLYYTGRILSTSNIKAAGEMSSVIKDLSATTFQVYTFGI